MKIIIGGRRSGKTYQCIKLCQKLNKKYGKNDTVILAPNKNMARFIYDMALEMGYSDMPYPITPDKRIDDMFRGSQYRGVIIDQMEMVMANILGSCALEGYSVTGWEPSDGQSFLISKEVRP